MIDLKNKVIVITGGSGLLGKAFIKSICEAGGTAINADKNCVTDKELNNFYCDITSEEEVNKLVKWVLENYKRLDGWINNAYPRTSDWGTPIDKIPYDSWRKNIDMHLNSYFLCSRIALEKMKELGGGSLINIGSIYGILGPDFSVYKNTNIVNPAAYSAIKGGIINMSRYLASYYGPFNINVNCISPGGIFDNQPEEFVKNYNAKVPAGRMGLPEDIAPTAVFLLSKGASYINGQNIVIDGGWSAI